ncbi:uncharacterized protein CLUP02_06137 [Colletotrichum lupini]|uniref:N-acetylglucosamine-induced protein 1 n=1 Tax=Colletotrichum lupini TaxID=145971 RepID=A0A9Q8SNQ8_9PEZI|nr:uncharacterized protein CLUP02_06137 [Colletotrichum lupini]UQC80653.1 hypothetical protein CLUP02_06137 [Colletotrichum lupini]
MGSLSGPAATALPYWQVNVPTDRRTDECPEGLRNLSAKDVGILSTPDAAYNRQTWTEVRRLVETNRLDLFQRVPSELRRYRLFIHHLIKEHGSVMNFVLRQRLGWEEPLRATEEKAREEIDRFVEGTFRARTEPDTVIWFKNWRSLKSVHAVEHFHVMLFDPDPAFIREITNGDVPQCDKFEA